MRNWNYKRFVFIGIVLIALGVNFNTTLKEYSIGSLGTLFIAIGGLFLIIGLSKKKELFNKMEDKNRE